MLVICAVLVPYMSSQKGEFIFLGSAQYNYSFSIRRKYLLVTLAHVLSLTMNIYDKSTASKVVDKPSKAIN